MKKKEVYFWTNYKIYFVLYVSSHPPPQLKNNISIKVTVFAAAPTLALAVPRTYININ